MKKLTCSSWQRFSSLAVAAPAFAAGRRVQVVSSVSTTLTHAQEMGGFTGTENPGVMHKGFSGWTGM